MEEKWMLHAKRVIACSNVHQNACVEAGGAVNARNVNARLRWPGMLGERYERAKHHILCVGRIHIPTEWVKARENLGSLQPLMRKLLDHEVREDVFLLEYRSKYAQYLSQWGPWVDAFGPTLCHFGLGTEDVTYVNFARCWQVSGNKRLYETMRSCAKAFPIRDVYEIVKPDAVIVLSGDSVFKRYKDLMGGVPADRWRNFPGRPHGRIDPEDIGKMRDWLATRLGLAGAEGRCLRVGRS